MIWPTYKILSSNILPCVYLTLTVVFIPKVDLGEPVVATQDANLSSKHLFRQVGADALG
jgi:hypothetical protein